MNDPALHLRGVLDLIDPDERRLAARQLSEASGRKKFLKRLLHSMDMHPDYAIEPEKGCRDLKDLLAVLRQKGAPTDCYVIASDSALDGSFQDLENILNTMFCEFGHGTILSCIPGKLGLFRTAWPHRHLIVSRP